MTSNFDLVGRRNRVFGRGASLFYSEPLQIVRGEGVCLFDEAGRRYVDLYNNVPCVGHGNAKVTDAIARAQRTLNVHSRYLHEEVVRFAERFLDLHSGAIERVVFCCSGTEAVDIAIQAARLATGRRGVLGSAGAYHGNSALVAQLTNVDPLMRGAGDVRAFPLPDLLRLPGDVLRQDAGAHYLARAEEALADLEATGPGVAGVVVCPIFANEGTPDVPPGFLSQLAVLVRSYGGLVIVDEVQAGYARTGRWWGYDHVGIQPDIVVTGKPMGNGVPLAAMAGSANLVENFRARTGYFSTFASSPLQAAAGLAVLDEIEQRRLLESVSRVGSRLRMRLEQLASNVPTIAGIRGHGLFLNVEIVRDRGSLAPDPSLTAQIVDELARAGFLTGINGAHSSQIKLRPPLVFEETHADEFVDAFGIVLNRIHAS